MVALFLRSRSSSWWRHDVIFGAPHYLLLLFFWFYFFNYLCMNSLCFVYLLSYYFFFIRFIMLIWLMNCFAFWEALIKLKKKKKNDADLCPRMFRDGHDRNHGNYKITRFEQQSRNFGLSITRSGGLGLFKLPVKHIHKLRRSLQQRSPVHSGISLVREVMKACWTCLLETATHGLIKPTMTTSGPDDKHFPITRRKSTCTSSK